ncbi:MAG: hypothetical protein LBE13_08250 [Bacteroidales bacterium]|jgi:hypothetical protein|nr:hypothetical protein [Bacteroidales bacterium]
MQQSFNIYTKECETPLLPSPMERHRGKGLIVIVCLLFLFAINSQAKNPIGTWKAYMAYQEAVSVAETPNHVFAVYKGLYRNGTLHNDGALFSYSPEDQEIVTYSLEDGLNDVGIKLMAYAPEMKVLVLVYDNSNIDLFYGKNNVVNMSDIVNKEEYLDKTVNSIRIIGKYAYISAAFGIAVLDLERKEIKNTYALNANTLDVCQWGNDFYAATTAGIKKALKSSNLMNPENWKPFQVNGIGDETKIEKMTIFNDHLILYNGSNRNSFYLSKEGIVKPLLNDICRDLVVLNEQLVICGSASISFYTDFNKRTKIDKTANSISSYNSNNIYWIVQSETGLTGIKKGVDATENSIIASEIKVNSPLRNYNFRMTYASDKLLVVGGSRWSDNDYKEGTFMVYENGKWTNFDDQLLAQKTGLKLKDTPWCRDFMLAVVDPRDAYHYFVASFGGGIYEFNDTTFVNLHSIGNSLLQTANPTYFPDLYVRIESLAFDRNNNLYVINQLAPNGMLIYTADKKWISTSYPPLSVAHPNQILITRNNLKWVNNIRLESAGIFVLNDNNTIDNQNDDIYYYSRNFVDQQGEDIKATYYLCLAEDQNGTVWAGTDNGIISFSSPEQVERGECNRIISTDSRGDGYRPLEGQYITTIAVDGGNRKWIGTRSEGVFVLDYSGSNLTVDNFTTRNSNLISNNITSIAINDKTGEVFIGTDRGLVSYMSEVIEGSSDYSKVYAFPNPIRPASNNQVIVTGLMADSNIKITDIAGNLIKQGASLGGQYVWNCTNMSGAIVKAGIYLVFAALPDGSQGVVTKIMVIK